MDSQDLEQIVASQVGAESRSDSMPESPRTSPSFGFRISDFFRLSAFGLRISNAMPRWIFNRPINSCNETEATVAKQDPAHRAPKAEEFAMKVIAEWL
jgi:hypothetical protein